MKDEDDKIKVYDNMEQVDLDCFIYEFPDALILEVKKNYIEKNDYSELQKLSEGFSDAVDELRKEDKTCHK